MLQVDIAKHVDKIDLNFGPPNSAYRHYKYYTACRHKIKSHVDITYLTSLYALSKGNE